jgi:hypothetical protein
VKLRNESSAFFLAIFESIALSDASDDVNHRNKISNHQIRWVTIKEADPILIGNNNSLLANQTSEKLFKKKLLKILVIQKLVVTLQRFSAKPKSSLNRKGKGKIQRQIRTSTLKNLQ